MIVKYIWRTRKKEGIYRHTRDWNGWFLFGLIPIYISCFRLTID